MSKDFESMEAFMRYHYRQRPWWRRLLPYVIHVRELRYVSISIGTGTTCSKPITKRHMFDLLMTNQRRWWQFPVRGFAIWY